MKISIRATIAASALALATLVAAPAPSSAQSAKPVYFAAFLGITADGEVAGLFNGADKLGLDVRKVSNGNWVNIKAHLVSNAPGWDIISLGAARCEEASAQGLLMPIDYSIVDKSKLPDQTLAHANYVNVYGYTYGLAYQKAKYGNNPPNSWADFWDVKKFPGRRAFDADGRYMLEAALMADGVAKGEVYKLLRTQAGIDRAFKKLEQIKPYINVWWGSVGQAMQLLHDNEADMVEIANARTKAIIDDGVNLGFVWNQAFLDYTCYCVPKNAANAKGAMQLINLAFEAKNQALFGQQVKYGPIVPKAFELGIITPEVMPWVSTAPQNIGKEFIVDPTWYSTPEAQAAFIRLAKFRQQ